MNSPIDLSRLPAPTAVEELDFERICSEMRDQLLQAAPQLADALELESEPLNKLLQVWAYRELLLRQRINDAAAALLLPYATGSDLDHIGVTYYRINRLLATPGDPAARPPIIPTYESDSDYRRRLLVSPDGHSTAGAAAAYVYHALSVDGRIRDATAINATAGQVLVTVLAHAGDGALDAELLQRVNDAVNADHVRPLTDSVQVAPAEVFRYQVRATLTVRQGPDPSVVRANAIAAARNYTDSRHALGRNVIRDAILSALFVEGVERVDLQQPVTDILCDQTQAAHCESIEVGANG